MHAHDGIITIVFELGVPRKHSVESTLVLVQDTINNFNEPVSGDIIFIRS